MHSGEHTSASTGSIEVDRAARKVPPHGASHFKQPAATSWWSLPPAVNGGNIMHQHELELDDSASDAMRAHAVKAPSTATATSVPACFAACRCACVLETCLPPLDESVLDANHVTRCPLGRQ